MSRIKKETISLTSEMYETYLKNRGTTKIDFVSFKALKKISSEDRRLIIEEQHIWKSGDRYYKLASAHYGNPSYWWIIAYYNNKPTEASVSLGDTILIPKPLSLLITLLSN